MIDAFRIDNHAPASSYPYRCRVNGNWLKNNQGEIRKFKTLREATAAGNAASRVKNPRRSSWPKGKTPPHLKKYLFK